MLHREVHGRRAGQQTGLGTTPACSTGRSTVGQQTGLRTTPACSTGRSTVGERGSRPGWERPRRAPQGGPRSASRPGWERPRRAPQGGPRSASGAADRAGNDPGVLHREVHGRRAGQQTGLGTTPACSTGRSTVGERGSRPGWERPRRAPQGGPRSASGAADRAGNDPGVLHREGGAADRAGNDPGVLHRDRETAFAGPRSAKAVSGRHDRAIWSSAATETARASHDRDQDRRDRARPGWREREGRGLWRRREGWELGTMGDGGDCRRQG